MIEISIVAQAFILQFYNPKLKVFKNSKNVKTQDFSICPANPPIYLWPYSYFNPMQDNFLLD